MPSFGTLRDALKYYAAEGFEGGLMRCASTGELYVAVWPPGCLKRDMVVECSVCGGRDSRLAEKFDMEAAYGVD